MRPVRRLVLGTSLVLGLCGAVVPTSKPPTPNSEPGLSVPIQLPVATGGLPVVLSDYDWDVSGLWRRHPNKNDGAWCFEPPHPLAASTSAPEDLRGVAVVVVHPSGILFHEHLAVRLERGHAPASAVHGRVIRGLFELAYEHVDRKGAWGDRMNLPDRGVIGHTLLIVDQRIPPQTIDQVVYSLDQAGMHIIDMAVAPLDSTANPSVPPTHPDDWLVLRRDTAFRVVPICPELSRIREPYGMGCSTFSPPQRNSHALCTHKTD